MSDFIIIAITPPHFFVGEAERINQILSDNQADFVHIRKPGSTVNETILLIENIDPGLRPRLKLHDHFQLLEEFNLGGIHLNGRNPEPIPNSPSLSKSIHSYGEIESCKNLDYYFISPVFDSISKKGYKAKFNLEELREKIKGTRAVALGGVTPQTIPLLKSLEFYGAAMLGSFFTTLK